MQPNAPEIGAGRLREARVACLHFQKKSEHMGAKVCRSPRWQDLGKQGVKIGLEDASRDAALSIRQFDNILGERRKVIKRRKRVENDVKRLPDRSHFPPQIWVRTLLMCG